jgi:hypothetical protein
VPELIPLGDGTKLLKDYPPHLTRATSLLELTHLARRVDGEAIGLGNTLISLAKLTERYTGFPLRKEKDVRSGDWAAALKKEQKDCKPWMLHSNMDQLTDQMPQTTSMPRC